MGQGTRIVDVFRLADGRVLLTMGLNLSQRKQIAEGAGAELVYESGQVSAHKILQYDIIGRSAFLEGKERRNVGLVLKGIDRVEFVALST